MSMSTHIIGFMEPDETYKRMRDVWNICKAAGVSVPNEVVYYFHQHSIDGLPNNDGISIELEDIQGVKQYKDDMCDGYEINLDEFPKDIRKIRFFNSF